MQLACERSDISRATFYRWKKDDKEFSEAIDEAIVSGASLINDMAESKLIAAIKEGNMTGIIYWLKHRHPAYTTRVELAVGPKQNDELKSRLEKVESTPKTVVAPGHQAADVNKVDGNGTTMQKQENPVDAEITKLEKAELECQSPTEKHRLSIQVAMMRIRKSNNDALMAFKKNS